MIHGYLPILIFCGISQIWRAPHTTQQFKKEREWSSRVWKQPRVAELGTWTVFTELKFPNILVSANSVPSKIESIWAVVACHKMVKFSLTDSREPTPGSYGSRAWPHDFIALKIFKTLDCIDSVGSPHLSVTSVVDSSLWAETLVGLCLG